MAYVYDENLKRLAKYDESRVYFAPEIVHLVACIVAILDGLERVDVLIARYQLGTLGNASSRLQLVTG